MRVRVSVGLLAPRVVIEETGEQCFIGVLAPSHYAKGKLVIQPLGGAAELTALGVVELSGRVGASEFHRNKESGIDARFVIDDSRLEEVMNFFEARDPRFSDIDPGREIVEELTGFELPGNDALPAIPPVLTKEMVGHIGISYARTVRQAFSDELGTSTLARADTPSRRLFHLFDLTIPQRIFDRLSRWEATRLLSEEEVATTEGGVQKGVSYDGITIADNFFW